MEQKNNDRLFKVVTIISLIVIVICLSIAYAALSQQLKIRGTANVPATNWSIEIPAKDGEGPKTNTGGDGTITYETETKEGITIIKNLKVTLRKPGDFGELIVPIKNTGEIDAHLAYVTGITGKISCVGTGINKAIDENIICGDSSNNNASVKYIIKYDNTILTDGIKGISDLNLSKDKTKNVVIRVEYLQSATKIPTSDVMVELPEIVFAFEQNM